MRRTTVLGAVVTAGLTAGGALLAVSAGSAQAATLSNNWYGAAPYVMPLDNSPPDLAPVMAATGQKSFMLAFILAPDGGGCKATWDGRAPLEDSTVATVVNRVRSAGGDVSVSIGGFGGTKLGQTCSSPAATAAAYQQVVSRYQLKAIDFDLEEPEYENLTAVNNELGAAQILQRDNPGLYVSITTAGTPAGTGFFGENVLKNAKSLGFTPNNFSIMPFDNGFSDGASQTAALEQFHTKLMTIFGWDSATAYNHEGVSLMNGRSDAGEMFPQSQFQVVFAYATSHRLSRFTFWSVNRDRQCSPPDNNGRTSGTCSSVPQRDWEFTTFTARFAGATPPQSPPPTTGSPKPPGGCTAPPWNPTTAYTGGQQVSFNGHQWTAKWWTQGDTPGNNSQGVWTDNGACSGGGTTAPPGQCTLPAWNSTTAYTGGMQVSFNGHKWTAKWWTQGDTPGNNAQDVWTDNGPC